MTAMQDLFICIFLYRKGIVSFITHMKRYEYLSVFAYALVSLKQPFLHLLLMRSKTHTFLL